MAYAHRKPSVHGLLLPKRAGYFKKHRMRRLLNALRADPRAAAHCYASVAMPKMRNTKMHWTMSMAPPTSVSLG
jgi:hypothetical protein